jgi:hypothetical protein
MDAPVQNATLAHWDAGGPGDPGSGDFQFACHLEDHYQRGMVVEVEVVE